MSTVQSNKSYSHNREIEGSETERIILQLLGWPSTQALKGAAGENQIRNFPITINNIN